ncbi:MAG: zinc-dependent alcohol dehydrogenase family protein [Xanthobacteraceae bacterium]|jgi:NADPH:quinone reductase-like Zn-dependent oxidoreductase
MARVVRFHEVGPPEVLQIEDIEIGEPGPGEIRLRVQAIGLNRAEVNFRSGHYLEQAKLPARLGYEAAGIVEAAGEGVTGWRNGDAVCVIPAFSLNDYGVYAERAIVPASAVVARPPGLGTVEAAAVWMPNLTAYGALIDVCAIGRGDAVVITAASSSVGLAAIQLANHRGAVSIAVTRTEAKRAGLRQAGAAHVVVTGSQDLTAEVMRITGGAGACLVFDPVSGPGIVGLVGALAHRGMLLLYGNLSEKAEQTPFPFVQSVTKGFSVRGYSLREILRDPGRRAKAQAFILEGLASGALKPRIDRTFPFGQIVAAHRYLEANAQMGKIVVTVS